MAEFTITFPDPCNCCSPECVAKVISATKTRVGWYGYLGEKVYLDAVFTDDDGTYTGSCGSVGPGWTVNWGVNRKTGAPTGVDQCGNPWTSGGGSPPWPGGGTPSSDTYQRWEEQQDEGTLSNEYTAAMLGDDVDELLAGVDFASLSEGETAIASFDTDESVIYSVSSGASLIAAYYTDDEANPSWILKSKLQFVAIGSGYCKAFYPASGGAPTYEYVPCTIGDLITIDPPTEPGEYRISCATTEEACA